MGLSVSPACRSWLAFSRRGRPNWRRCDCRPSTTARIEHLVQRVAAPRDTADRRRRSAFVEAIEFKRPRILSGQFDRLGGCGLHLVRQFVTGDAADKLELLPRPVVFLVEAMNRLEHLPLHLATHARRRIEVQDRSSVRAYERSPGKWPACSRCSSSRRH